MKYINQKQYPDIPYITRQDLADEKERAYGLTTTVATSGCGLCAAIMMLDRLLIGVDFSLADAIDLAEKTGANRRVGTDYGIYAPALAERFGLDYEASSDPERLLMCLRTGGCAVANTAGDREGYIGVFSHIGHYVVVISEQRDGRIVILDPALMPGRYDEPGRKDKVEVKNGFCLSDMRYLAEDVRPMNPGFYLFWRREGRRRAPDKD